MIRKLRHLSSKIETSIYSKQRTDHVWLGAASIMFACLLFALNSMTVKLISSYYSGWLISFVRFVIGIILVYAALKITGRSSKIYDRKTWFLRGFFGGAQMVVFFLGVQITSSGRCTLLSCTYPIFVAIFGHFIFRQKIRKRYILVMLFALAGATLVFYDGSRYPLFGNALCLFSGVINGMSMNYVKKAREKNNSFMVYLSPCIFGLLITSFSVSEIPHILSVSHLGVMVLIGTLAFVGQVFMGFGFKFVSATVGSILGMSEILFSIILSFSFVAEEMPPKFFAGTSLILAALVFNHLLMKRDLRK
jgi:drug/metabolite transporter (DMT)-like permease